MELARSDDRFKRLFRKLARSDILILDGWGPDRLTVEQRRDLMEIVERRFGRRSTVITSQLRWRHGTKSSQSRLSPTRNAYAPPSTAHPSAR
jgi:DNA replication protein DnaC